MKDYWCALAKGVRRELEIYKVLKAKGVKYVATALAGGDVGGDKAQMTQSQVFMQNRAPGALPAPRFHHRLILDRLGRALETYESQKELILCLNDALDGEFSSHE